MYFFQFLVNKDVPVRQETSASTIRQYPTHRGKNAHCVRRPVRDQFNIQNTTARTSPNQPCRGNFFTLVSICQLNHKVLPTYEIKAITRQDAW